MQEEINKILDKLYLNFEKAGLTAPEYSDLRDYITNLQEENIKIKKYYNVNVNKYEDLLIKYNTIERWYQLNKSRNEKAIEYINKFESIKAYYEYIDEDGYDEYNYDDDFKKDILNILKGDNK